MCKLRVVGLVERPSNLTLFENFPLTVWIAAGIKTLCAHARQRRLGKFSILCHILYVQYFACVLWNFVHAYCTDINSSILRLSRSLTLSVHSLDGRSKLPPQRDDNIFYFPCGGLPVCVCVCKSMCTAHMTGRYFRTLARSAAHHAIVYE